MINRLLIQKPIFWIALLTLLFLGKACTSVIEPDLNNLGRAYFPVEIGRFIEYDVEERNYTTTNPVEVLHYQIREEITESYLDVENETAYKLVRSRREQAGQAWVLDSVWSVKLTPGQALRTENSLTFIKLIFPPIDTTTWNGNALNNLGEERYQIVNLGEPSTVGDITFPNTLRVIQNDLCSKVNLDLRNEEYAENVGMIYKQDWRIAFKQGSFACSDSLGVYCDDKVGTLRPPLPYEGCIEFGRIYTLKIIAYGKK